MRTLCEQTDLESAASVDRRPQVIGGTMSGTRPRAE
jgi:hypothetical protein